MKRKANWGSMIVGAACLVVLASAVIWGVSEWSRYNRTADQWMELGRQHIHQQKYVAAIGALEHSITLEPSHGRAWALLSEAHCRQGNTQKSQEAFERTVQLAPSKATALGIRIGQIWMTQQRLGPAAVVLRRVLELDPRLSEPDRLLAQIYASTGHRQDVIRHRLQLVRKSDFRLDDLVALAAPNPCAETPIQREKLQEPDSDDKSPNLLQASILMGQARYSQAELLLLDLTRANPDDTEAQGVLAELYAAHFPHKFVAWQATLPVTAEQDSRIWAGRGRWLARWGTAESAIRCLHESLQREPEQLSSTILLGQLLKAQHAIELGNAFSERAVRLQRINDLSGRMVEPRAADFLPSLIEELEATGRLWEAWGWCVIGEPWANRSDLSIRTRRVRLQTRLHPDGPQTEPSSLPGQNEDWSRFPLPDWSLVSDKGQNPDSVQNQAASGIRFADRGVEAGLGFRFVNSYSAAVGRKIFEAMGAGVAVVDFDADGWPDLYFPQGNLSPVDSSRGPSDRLYRNQCGLAYQDVTEPSGIDEKRFSQGVTAGDFDNDGFPDLYVGNLGQNTLYHNNGDGTFSDVTVKAGLKQAFWTVSCAIADFNGDGLPELFDVNYLQGPDLLTGYCTDTDGRRTVCRPTAFDPTWNTVSINRGDGRFEEQQAECGLDLPRGMGLGLLIADFNDDGRPDVFVANDMTPNYLLINEPGDTGSRFRFRDEAILRNVAVDDYGMAQACMGIACADVNRDGLPDLFVTNFAQESNTLYLSQNDGFYEDRTQASGLREPSFGPLGFGTQFLDADNDGWDDLAVVNGHLDQFVQQPFRMKAQFFQGGPGPRFREVLANEGGGLFDQPRLGRGLAVLDWNRDGRPDFVATDLEDAVLLAENQTQTENRWLGIRLRGTRSSRDAVGSKLQVIVKEGEVRYLENVAGDGYQCKNEQFLRIGLGTSSFVDELQIQWPSGEFSRFQRLKAGFEWLIVEGRDTPVSLELQ